MPEPSAGLAVRNAWQRMCRLLLPFRPGRWLAIYAGQPFGGSGAGPAIAEFRRLRPYYRGTRLLTRFGLLFILLAFVLPLAVIFVAWDTFTILLIAYAVAFIAASIGGMAVQSAMDAVLALQYERKTTFAGAVKGYLALARSKGDLALGYMAIKMAIDLSLSTLALCFFLPALLLAMGLMINVTNAVSAGLEWRSGAFDGMLLVVALAALGLAATLLVTLPAAAFYGYYTEEAVRMMQEG